MTQAGDLRQTLPFSEPQRAALEDLLTASGLPTAGLIPGPENTIVVVEDEALVATATVNLYGDAGLLRSVAVESGRRGSRLGDAVTRAAIELASGAGIRTLYLLTESAAGFFPRFGFQAVDRGEVPEVVASDPEFTRVCPSSATVMAARI